MEIWPLAAGLKCVLPCLQLVHEDIDIADVSLKCLSLLVQLFGGEHPDAMTKENMVSAFSTTLQS